MTNRVKNNDVKYNLIHWADADVPTKIRDCSYAGKLMPMPSQANGTHFIY